MGIKPEYCIINKNTQERFDLGPGNISDLFPLSSSNDRKEIKLQDVFSNKNEIIQGIQNYFQIRPGYNDKLNDNYVESIAQDIWDGCTPSDPNSETPLFEIWEKSEFEQEFRGDMTLKEFLDAYPYTGTRFYI